MDALYNLQGSPFEIKHRWWHSAFYSLNLTACKYRSSFFADLAPILKPPHPFWGRPSTLKNIKEIFWEPLPSRSGLFFDWDFWLKRNGWVSSCTLQKREVFFILVELYFKCVFCLKLHLGRICKKAIQEHINKTHSQNRRNLKSTNLQTKPTGSEISVSVGSWHVSLKKCRLPSLKEEEF